MRVVSLPCLCRTRPVPLPCLGGVTGQRWCRGFAMSLPCPRSTAHIVVCNLSCGRRPHTALHDAALTVCLATCFAPAPPRLRSAASAALSAMALSRQRLLGSLVRVFVCFYLRVTRQTCTYISHQYCIFANSDFQNTVALSSLSCFRPPSPQKIPRRFVSIWPRPVRRQVTATQSITANEDFHRSHRRGQGGASGSQFRTRGRSPTHHRYFRPREKPTVSRSQI
jgi:hypothetical protein